MLYMLRKLCLGVIALFCVASLTFALMKTLPGDPFQDEKALPKEIHNALRKHYGLDAPLHEQYFNYIYSIATWNFGPSLKYKGRTVNDVIKEGFPVSLALGLEALFLSVGGGLFLGGISTLYRKHWLDKSALVLMTIGISLPNFALAALLQYFLAMKLPLFPVARWGTLSHTILPAVCLAALPLAYIARLVRTKMEEILQEDYIKTAKAKGLSDAAVLWRHVFRNSMLPVVSYMGQLSANILVGSFVIEKIFAIPGLGQWFVKSVMNRDYSLIMGLTIFYSALLLLTVTLFDIALLWIDPRLRRGKVERGIL